MKKAPATIIGSALLMCGLIGSGEVAHATTSTQDQRASQCKQISSILKDIKGEEALARVYLGLYDTFDAAGDSASANESLDEAQKALKGITASIKRGSKVAQNPAMKLQFTRWYNIVINDLDNGASLERKARKAIDSLLIDGKC